MLKIVFTDIIVECSANTSALDERYLDQSLVDWDLFVLIIEILA